MKASVHPVLRIRLHIWLGAYRIFFKVLDFELFTMSLLESFSNDDGDRQLQRKRTIKINYKRIRIFETVAMIPVRLQWQMDEFSAVEFLKAALRLEKEIIYTFCPG